MVYGIPTNLNCFFVVSMVLVESQRLLSQKGQSSNLLTENWEESPMADASPRTDISTDVDTDEKNQRV